jgi:hypothetical protein
VRRRNRKENQMISSFRKPILFSENRCRDKRKQQNKNLN